MEPNTPVPQAPDPRITPPPPVQTPAPQSTPPVSGTLEGPVALLTFSWGLFTSHWKKLVPIILLPNVIALISQIAFNTKNPAIVIVGVVVAIVAAVFSIASMPAVAQSIHLVATNPTAPITLKGQYSFGFSLFWSTLLVVIINALVNLGSLVLFIIPGVIVMVYTSVYIFAFTLDGKRGFAALVESFNLVNGRWLAVVGRMLFLGLVMVVFWLIVAGLQFVVNAVIGAPPSVPGQSVSMGTFIVQSLFGLVITGIIGPLTVAYMYRLYSSLKSTRLSETKSGFKGWLIAFLCIGILVPIIAIGSMAAIVGSLGSAEVKAWQAKLQAEAQMSEVQKQIDSAILENTDSSVQVEIPEAI
jgi:hypothetical protein